MNLARNPFYELYVTETINPENFVEIFSPLLVFDTMALFHHGNIILIGTQGSGKSMLLNLLKPEVRIAFKNAKKEFPVQNDIALYLSAGINLTRSGAIDFGQRSIEANIVNETERFPSYFADFLNYWIIIDLLSTIDKYISEVNGSIAKDMGINVDNLKFFSKKISEHDCWNGFLEKIDDYKSLKDRLIFRISSYRNFLNYNTDIISDEIKNSKTSVGVPISVTVETLWSTGVIPSHIPVFVRIDQYEELSRLEESKEEEGLYIKYSEVVNKLIGTRDPRVSYKIGTRRHAWKNLPKMHGTASVIEELRNYKVVDIDDILRRKEHRRGLFSDFAEDVFTRRLKQSKLEIFNNNDDFIKKIFGPSLTSDLNAKLYAGEDPKGILTLEKDWPEEVKRCLLTLSVDNPLSAKLGEAWVRQQINRKNPILPHDNFYPWEESEKKWWKKERNRLAILQIAAQKRQKMIWSGKKDIIALSGDNILVFVSICQYIWDAWLRSHPPEVNSKKYEEIPRIHDYYIQDEGIQLASAYWYRKIRTDPGGDSRQRFINYLGSFFRRRLQKDTKMSYPGENGFSLPTSQLEQDKEVFNYLNDAVAFGVLIERRHTSKNSLLGDCRKWYINPILSPYFQITVSHTKEPYYASINTVRDWISNADVIILNSKIKTNKNIVSPKQLKLFGNEE